MKILNTYKIVLACLAFSIGIFYLLYVSYQMQLKDAMSATAIIFTAFGLFMTAFALYENHRWNRYSYTLSLMEGWNNQVRIYLDILDIAFPDFKKIPDDLEGWGLSEASAKDLVSPKNDEHEKLRNALIRTLNFFETMARGYELGSVDRQTVKESYAPIMIDVWVYFSSFANELGSDMKRDPWPPLTRVCEEWRLDNLRSKAEQLAQKARQKHKKALNNLDLKRPSGK